MLDVQEKSKAVYTMLKFGGADASLFGLNVRGNVGVRYVKTDVVSTGGVSFPTANWYNQEAAIPCNTPLSGGAVTNISCWLTPDLLAFSNGGGADNDIDTSYENWLPSFNVRFGIDDHQYVRFGYSRSMSRPDFGLLRNFVGIQAPALNNQVDSPYIQRNAAGQVTGYNFVFNADSGFGGLKPITADNFDLSYENYLGKSSSVTLGVFYKKLNGSIAYGEFDREFDNNGTTQVVTVRGPRNGEGGGTLKGVEIGFQTFFDFLPGAWSGSGHAVELHARRSVGHQQLESRGSARLRGRRHDCVRRRLAGQRRGARFASAGRHLRRFL